MKIDVQQLAHVLTTAPDRYIGITPNPLSPPSDPPCSLITERTLNGFHYALHTAAEYWPDAALLAIVSSNALVHPQTPAQLAQGHAQYPAGFERLQSPQILFQFEPS